LSDEEVANLVKDLQARGPGTSRSRREALGWYELSSELSNPQGTIQGEHGGKRYVLLSQRPEDTLLTFWGESKPWCLEKASASLDAQGHALMALELDEEGARRMEKLTEAHVGRSLAVLVDDQVITIAVIRDVLKGRLQITGLFTLAEAQAIVAVLMEGISH
jgi:preprotein translocase subunit SecD